jgi:predicted SprT family Zn-dependent metalloprotease
VKVINKTVWRTDHLKAILQRCAEQEFDDGAKRKRLRVTVEYTRRGESSGCAFLNTNISTVRIANPKGRVHDWATGGKKAPINPADVEAMAELKAQFASVACHEFAHNRGMDHKAMPNNYKWHGRWREYVAWAESMPLEVKPPKAAPSKENLLEGKFAHAMKMLKIAETRQKRARTIQQKWARKVRYYMTKAAASRGESK